MNPDTIIRILRLAARLLEMFITRRASGQTDSPATRADEVVARVAPLAERLMDRVAPTTLSRTEQESKAARGGSALPAMLVGALAAGGAAYLVLRQQRLTRERYQLANAAFPPELLEVLSAPGGGGRLEIVTDGLRDPETKLFYPVIDGIPDFIAVSEQASVNFAEARGDLLSDLTDPLKLNLLGNNHLGNAALAGAVAVGASNGWVLSGPCSRGRYEVEMARANPQANFVCVDDQWDNLLETRRQARRAGLTNLYFARGEAALLPLRAASVAGGWSVAGLYSATPVENLATQLTRVIKPGGLLAGVALVSGENVYLDQALQALGEVLAARIDEATLTALFTAAGTRGLRTWREGSLARFIGTRE